MAYADLDAVRGRVPYRTIDEDSDPSADRVQAWLDEAEAELDGTLRAAGLPAPYSAAAAVTILGRIVSKYASALVRQAYAAAGGDGSNDDGKAEEDEFYKTLDDIGARPALWAVKLGGAGADGAATKLRSHVTSGRVPRARPWVTRDESF